MSHVKQGGSTQLGRDSNPQYLGVKLFAGQRAKIGSIIIRQRGSKFKAGKNVREGKDNTLYAVKTGLVNFITKKIEKFDGSRKLVKVVNVE